MKERKKITGLTDRIWRKGIVFCMTFTVLFFCIYQQPYAESDTKEIAEPSQLYALSAVLMDADSGRILYAKNGQEERAMASTTKIMTCILALEMGNLDAIVTASAEAASQPEVRLGVREGEQFYLKDLLYSLMLESHNDAAVVIAESVGSTVEGFADLMNQKAGELGCEHTYFITPNGLDAEDEVGIHHTTAEDLARIMKYCILDSPKQQLFREITGTEAYQFTDCSGNFSYSCANHNSFLHMMEGAFSGKTGFTADAGYCYVGALENEERTFIVALLACGWPNHKSYKWSDSKKLLTYGIEHFHYRNVELVMNFDPIPVWDGIPDGERLSGTSTVMPVLEEEMAVKTVGKENTKAEEKETTKTGQKETAKTEEKEVLKTSTRAIRLLLRDDENVTVETELESCLKAPVEKGVSIGNVQYKLGDEILYTSELVTEKAIEKRNYIWCLSKIFKIYCMK